MITRYLIFILAILCFSNLQGQPSEKLNVVLIIIDDLNDFPEGFYGHHSRSPLKVCSPKFFMGP